MLSSSQTPDEVRYVGQTIGSLRVRFNSHIYRMNKDKRDFHISRWMRQVYANGFHVVKLQLEEVDDTIINEREIKWIQYFKDSGFSLTNMTEGGSGGVRPSEEVRKKISDSKLGKPRPAHVIEQMRVRMAGKYVGELNPNYGKKHTEEARHKMSEARKGQIITEDHKQKISISMKNSDRVKQISKPVICVSTGQRFDSVSDAARFVNTSPSNISNVCNKNKWCKTCKGLVFEWAV
jgi:group I intron endonuclease